MQHVKTFLIFTLISGTVNIALQIWLIKDSSTGNLVQSVVGSLISGVWFTWWVSYYKRRKSVQSGQVR